MKNWTFSSFLISLFFLTNCRPAQKPVELVKEKITKNITEFQKIVDNQLLPLAISGKNTDSIQKAFLECRLVYKKMEYMTEYYMPTTMKLVNGPPLPDIEMEENKVFEPGGLQVIEEFLYPSFDTTQRKELVTEIKKMRAATNRMTLIWENIHFREDHVFDAVRLQVFRLLSLGMSGFDAPLSKNSMTETAVSLAAMQEIIAHFAKVYPKAEKWEKLRKIFTESIAYLEKYKDFDSFDRMTFITEFGNPISSQLLDYQVQLNIPFIKDYRALNANARTLFEENAFNPNFYTNNLADTMTAEKIKLGEKLFYDPILSSNNQRSCATCHQPDKAFTDGLIKSENIHRTGTISRNTPTIINAALQKGQFYDFRKGTLEAQSQDVIANKDEMHGDMERATAKLQANAEYLALFKKTFPNGGEKITSYQVQNALASYERTLVSFNSRFDRYMRGNTKQMNEQEIKGFNLFMGKAKCGACHFMPLFNGTVPPQFIKTESEVLGVPKTAGSHEIDPDLGRFAINPIEPWKHAFKTTTVRNAELTAPYMHNGIYKTLEEVVDFYNKGGGVGLGIELPNQTLPFDKLNLTEEESKDLVAFMKTLTDVPVSGKKELASK